MPEDVRFEVSFGSTRFDPLVEQNNSASDDNQPNEIQAWFVQFQRPLSNDDRERLKQSFGLRLTSFVPQLSYIERLLPSVVEGLRDDPLVRAVSPYTSAVKVGSVIKEQQRDDNAGKELFVNAALFEDTDPEQVTSQLTALGAHAIVVLDDRGIQGGVTVRFLITVGSIEDVARLPEVRWIEPIPEVVDDEDTMSAVRQDAGTHGMHSVIWEEGLHGEGQIIGILDNGQPDIGHCFFRDPMGNTPGLQHRKVLALRNATGHDSHAHATFVAGCAAGDDFHAPGQAPSRGGAWAAKLVIGNRRDMVAFDNPNAATATSLHQELTAAAGAGAAIHSNSWHAVPQGRRRPAIYDLMAVDGDRFTWLNEDHLVLGASGNNNEEQGPPGVAKNAICVSAASDNSEGAGLGDGNPGPTADGRRKPDLMTVGCQVHSAIVGTDCQTGPKSSCASSYATPLAAAAAALVRQYFVEGFYPSGTRVAEDGFVPSGALLKAALLNSAVATSGISGYPSKAGGWGLVQLQRTLFFPSRPRQVRVRDVRNQDGLRTGDAFDWEITVDGSDEPLKITLVWTEPPGAVGAETNPVVNDLDLVVRSPSGDTFLGNVFEGGRSQAGGEPDPRNNVEMVVVPDPEPGQWQVRVKATAVNVGRPGQGFALVATGRLTGNR